MSRRHAAEKREVLPDPKFNDLIVAKFVNCLMEDGKKGVAEAIVYDAFEIIAQKLKRDPLEVFKEALEKARPAVEVKSRRVGGATYQVPVEVRPAASLRKAMRWIKTYAGSRGDKSMSQRVANEVMDIILGRGNTVKKKDDTHKMAEANKAFAHFRW
jgi:small subunit ribosomal protein S7